MNWTALGPLYFNVPGKQPAPMASSPPPPPMRLVRDPAKFPSLIQALSDNPQTGRRDPDAIFDYLGSNPEALPSFLQFFSDAGTSQGLISFSPGNPALS
ncbi:uncharacterized protein VP01_910g2 [Puccinia sorghi]|uniref:Catalase core domain-containing protein n=1 Tax=Puccinia sorghi TaxID=27349 RepID=A0A0L6U7J5_9BASI|nr:uncharacterized protein VP01_910g2 [Puccinia sorghi]